MSVPDRVTGWSVTGTILIVLSVGFLIFASAFPYWTEEADGLSQGYPSQGLWEICFDDEGQSAPVIAGDELMKLYYGCNYVFDRKLRHIVSWYFTDWFTTVAVFVTIGLVFQPLAFILNIIFYMKVCTPHLEYLLLGASALISWLTGFLCAIAILVFGVESEKDQNWIPEPKYRHLSYSFGVCAVVPVLAWFAGMCHMCEFLRLKCIRDRNARIKVYQRGQFAKY